MSLLLTLLLLVQLGSQHVTARSLNGGAAPGSHVGHRRTRGLAEVSERIVGGKPAAQGSYPWFASLTYKGDPYCGGALIAPNVVVTAAHCVEGDTRATVEIGRYDLYANDGEVRTATEIIVHPNYDSSTTANDIALLHFDDPSTKTPIALPSQAAGPNLNDNDLLRVIGFGLLKEDGNMPRLLQEVDVPFVSKAKCEKAYPGELSASMFCAGTGGKDSCQGDSGGPMFVSGSGGYVHTGIVSWGSGCAQPKYPGVYTSTAYMRNWIDTTMAKWSSGGCSLPCTECQWCDEAREQCVNKPTGDKCSVGECDGSGSCETNSEPASTFMFGALYWMPAMENDCKTTCKNNTANGYKRALRVAKHSKNYACGYLASPDTTDFWEGTKLVGSDVCSGVAINSNSYLEQYTKTSYHCGCGDGLERWTWTWTCPDRAPYSTWTCRARKQDKTWYFGWIVEFDDGTAACACSNCGYDGTYSEDFQMMCTKDDRTKSGGSKPGRRGGKSWNVKPGGNARKSEDEETSPNPE